MKTITAARITDVVAKLCVQANVELRRDVRAALERAYASERNARARRILGAVRENAAVAQREKIALCQDTGMPVVFVRLGQGARIQGGLIAAIERGVDLGYRRGNLRNSLVTDPLKRGFAKFSPPVIHTEITKGDKLGLTVLPKGFGCENKSRLKMLKPTAGVREVKKFVVESVERAGPDACPPYIVGVGIGGTADYAALLAKKALLRKVTGKSVKLERELLREINKLNIGPMGLGGKATALAVNIETYPTHIAGLPVAVNISCHALRSASVEI